MWQKYSPRRVCTEAKRFGAYPAESMDLTTGWDFKRKDHRTKKAEFRAAKPFLLAGSLESTMFSQLQTLSRWKADKAERCTEAIGYVMFVMKLYKIRMEGGRVFLHEHLARAASWKLKEVQEVANDKEAFTSVADQSCTASA